MGDLHIPNRHHNLKIIIKGILRDTRTSVTMIRKYVLGLDNREAGTHSVRASITMRMFLAKEPIYTIMLIGRWSSDASLAYIRK